MRSVNFELLRAKWLPLADLGAFAEQYAHPDPSSALVKLRTFAELVVDDIFRKERLLRPVDADLFQLLKDASFEALVPRVVRDKLHTLRIRGNKAAHGEPATPRGAMWVLEEAYEVGKWLHVRYGDGAVDSCPPFREPPASGADGATRAQLKREKKEALERLAAREAQLQYEVQNARRQADAAREETVAATGTAAELQTRLEQGQQVADALHLSEEDTRRRLIDSQLATAGWKVGDRGTNTEEVTQEERVLHQPTRSGEGKADYVLWDDDGLPLAVIEAKRTATDAEAGRNQAKLYADGLEKMHGQRPVIFCTNGYEVWIWDDAQGYPSRPLQGFYSKDSLQYLLKFQRATKKPLESVPINTDIVERLYQLEGIKRVNERFSAKRRHTLVVMATGTGKTRVAIALVDVLIRANWAKRILFLCDRRELRKQAKNAFTHFLAEPLTVVTGNTSKDRDKRIYVATYPAMQKIFESFDVGFFDVVIADESHRSIYNRYRHLFYYFDALQVGLTATPLGLIHRNTFQLFRCLDRDPTANYPFDQAVEEKFLVPYDVFAHTTELLRRGIKYSQLSEEQKQQLIDDPDVRFPELIEFEAKAIDKRIFNKDTNREILRNLMEKGIRDATGQQPGKSIIFARNHKHAMLLRELFDEMYPQYGGNFCQVIDNYEPRAEQLIDDFKGQGTNLELTIAISVDMLDTGIDVPELVNLVFAKPIFSPVKFEQMIGRGTRLCRNLFGPGRDKQGFRIFDHWGNFERFEKEVKEPDPPATKALVQQVFEARMDLAQVALEKPALDVFESAVQLVHQMLADLPDRTIAVRERWRERQAASDIETLRQFSLSTVAMLKEQMAQLMQWVPVAGHAPAYRFDQLMTDMQTARLKGAGRFNDLKDDCLNLVNNLQMHLNQVRAEAELVAEVKSAAFWEDVTHEDLERARVGLRRIIQYQNKTVGPGDQPKIIDVTDGDIKSTQRKPHSTAIEMEAYRRRVEEALQTLLNSNPTLGKIRRGEPVTEADLSALTSLVLTQHPGVDLHVLEEFYGETAGPLDSILRSIVGMDANVVEQRFAEFGAKHPLSADQVRFLRLLKNHIAKFGAVELNRLYEPPFTQDSSDGIDGVFPDEDQATELVRIVESFKATDLGVSPA